MNLSAALGVLEFKTLLVDADPQANATSGIGINPKEVTSSIYECIVGDELAADAIISTKNPNLDIIPAHIDLVGAELELINVENREYMMRKALAPILSSYDFIIIDASPSLGPYGF